MPKCNDMSDAELSHLMIVQSIRLYFAMLGFHMGYYDPDILERAVSQKRVLIDLIKQPAIRNDMHQTPNELLSSKRSERTFHIRLARMQWNLYRLLGDNPKKDVQALGNFYLEPLLKQGTDTTRLLYLRILGKLCVLIGGMSYPDFSALESLLDQGATIQESQQEQGFIFSLTGFMNSVSIPAPSLEKSNEINDLSPGDWHMKPSTKGVKLFYTNLAEAFNPTPGVCE